MPLKTERFVTQILQQYTLNQVCTDSRLVKPGDLFICIPCAKQTENTTQAITNGAKAILGQAEVLANFTNQVKCIESDNPRLFLSLLARSYFKTQPQTLVAVTGTNGKSSTVSMIRQFWELLGLKAASFGTVGLEITPNSPVELPPLPPLTTYDSMSFFKILQNLAAAQIDHVAFEASSHGLAQYRIHGSELSVAGFTNLTQDHLDYHTTMESYFTAKTKLFSEVLPSGKVAVLNANSPYFEHLKVMIPHCNVISYGIEVSADLIATKIRTRRSNITFDLSYQGKNYPDLCLNLTGSFQVENVLCAMAMIIGTGESLNTLLALVPKLKPISGRMELIGSTPNGADVYVDYAHTPDALERALKSLRLHTQKCIWVIFGCGGDRDSAKRPIMGKIAATLADVVVVTDDNPRSEDPATIRLQIIRGAPNAQEIDNRERAIINTIAHLGKGDTLLIAGKGHELGQTIGDKTYSFSDIQKAKDALVELDD